jgi:hypothetical protein
MNWNARSDFENIFETGYVKVKSKHKWNLFNAKPFSISFRISLISGYDTLNKDLDINLLNILTAPK